MFKKITSKFFSSSNHRQINKFRPIVDKINKFENQVAVVKDKELKIIKGMSSEDMERSLNIEKEFGFLIGLIRLAGRLKVFCSNLVGRAS